MTSLGALLPLCGVCGVCGVCVRTYFFCWFVYKIAISVFGSPSSYLPAGTCVEPVRIHPLLFVLVQMWQFHFSTCFKKESKKYKDRTALTSSKSLMTGNGQSSVKEETYKECILLLFSMKFKTHCSYPSWRSKPSNCLGSTMLVGFHDNRWTHSKQPCCHTSIINQQNQEKFLL